MGRDRIIENYVQRLRNWEEPITADNLSAIAEEVGLGPDDMVVVQQKAQESFELGRNYLEFDCLDDAIENLTVARSLDPLNLETIQTLAYAYDLRYGKHKNPRDKKQAIALAQRCLEINPNSQKAVALISSLEYEANGRQRIIWLVLAVVLAIGGLKSVMDFINKRSEVEQLAQKAILETQNGQSDVAASGSEVLDSDTSVSIKIPVTFEQPGLILDPRLSVLDNYEDSSYYTLQAVLLNDSAQEVDTLTLQIEYLDKDGEVIETDSREVMGIGDAIVRPGDSYAIDLIHKTTPDLSSIRFSVATIEEALASLDGYEPATPVGYTWDAQQPPQLAFELDARSEELNVYDLTDSAYFSAEWAVTNIGDSAIGKLKLQVDFFNMAGQLMVSEEVLAVYGSDAPMLPDEVRPVGVNKSLETDYEYYEVRVVEAE
ncbi:MAG: hypothetical protein KTR27_16175 [Leptolyngbyaceae cyanobacterium MAG.088]|nr:hypothetical protein [Leptolyngbyaceae cyanobacterium MAG.088]